jgi:filamentous hemagglutinin family protein
MSGITQNWRCWCSSLVVVSVLIASLQDSVFAQITPDSTLPSNSTVTREGNTFNITGGTQVLSNLFHSFSEFSVPNGGTAIFNNALDIQNIISRVTGGSASNIDGLIRTSGTANLFLINPNGIIFGRNASLDVKGSFAATTANALQFGNQGFFSTKNTNTPELLTVNPSAFLFNQIAAAPIQNKSVALARLPSENFNTLGLRVPDGKSLLLVGGNIIMDGGFLNAFGGRVELGGVLGAGTVGLSVDGSNLGLTYATGVQRADVSLSNKARINVIAGEGGTIVINARNLDISGESGLFAGIGASLGTIGGKAGNIEINATDKVKIDGSSPGVVSIVGPSAIGNGSDINIQTGTLSLTNGAQLIAFTFGQGNAGNILVNASDSVTGNNGSALQTSTSGKGNAGNVTIQAGGKVSFDGVGANNVRSGATSIVQPGAVGNGGNIHIQAGSLSLTNGANLNTPTAGQGNAGNVTIKTDGLVSFDGAGILNGSPYASGVIASVFLGTGKGGDIMIAASSLSVTNGAQLSTFTVGQGNAGNVTIKTDGPVSFDGKVILNGLPYPSGVLTAVGGTLKNSLTDEVVSVPDKLSGVIPSQGFFATGNGGDIKITAGSLFLTDGAVLVSSSIFGQGNAGNISVHVNDYVSLTGGGTSIGSTVEAGGVGKGGNIDIQSRSLSANGGAVLTAITRGQGNAGNILVNARDEVELSGVAPFPVLKDGNPGGSSSGLLTNTEKGAIGQGGEISVTTGTLRILNGAVLSVRSRSAKRGGNITVNANVLEATGGGQFLTTAYNSGDAGNITVKVKDRITISGSDPTFNERFKQVADAFSNRNEIAQFTIDPVSPASGLFANTDVGSTGNGGSIFIDPIKLTIIDESGIAVNSLGKGNAGSLQIQAGTVTLDSRSFLSATTASTKGGNINLQVQDLILMRRGAQISTNAGTAQAGGDGGNITINAPSGFILAVPSENSDITANAFTGSGGRVNIKAFGIYGIQPRESLTLSSDITASSDFGTQGTVELNTPEIDPDSGLLELPIIPVDTQVAQGCYSPSYTQSSFVINGRGGLPPNPKDVLTPEAPHIDWVSIKPSNNNRSLAPITSKLTNSTPKRIVEATGATLNAKGQIVLSANSSTISPHTSRQNPIQCHGS